MTTTNTSSSAIEFAGAELEIFTDDGDYMLITGTLRLFIESTG